MISFVRRTTSRRGLSLETKLPLLILALLLALVLLGSMLAYREVRSAALVAAAERIERVTTQLGDLSNTSIARRLELMRLAAASPAVAGAVRGGFADSAALADAVDDLRTVSDSFPIEVWDGAGTPAAGVGAYPVEWGPAQRARARAEAVLPDSGGFSPIFTVNSRPFIWAVVPIRRGGRTTGWLADLRPIGSPATARQIGDLIGAGSKVYYANVDGGPWISLTGDVVPRPMERPPTETTSYSREGAAYMARAVALANAPIVVVVESPMSAVLARPQAFLRRLLVGAGLLLVLGAFGAWLLSRWITQPLRELNRAAGAIAAGDYARRVGLDRGDELGELAQAFNDMAGDVERALSSAEQARAEAVRASRAKSDFLATMSHEIRTPINAIMGYADLLLHEVKGPLTEAQRRQVERLRSSGHHLIGLVDEVLDLARIESGRLEVKDGVGEAREAIAAAAAVVGPEAAARGLDLELPGGDGADALWYRGDPQRVKQILINLLSNAVKFTDRGGRIRVGLATDLEAGTPGQAVFRVEDTGIGIPADRLEEIFEPFVQVDSGPTRSHGGAGLGLAISRRLARHMGGDLEVVSEPRRGSTFTLRLPLARPAAATAPAAAHGPRASTGTG